MTSPLTTLAIETSTPQGSVAVFRGPELLFSETFQGGRSHSSLLFVALERALAVVPGVDQIAVGLGPGSYAGVRIAISAAIGLGLASGAKLVGIPSIVTLGEGDYIALGDARRESYYFARVRNGECLEGPELVPASEVEARLAGLGVGEVVFASEPLPLAPHAQIRSPSAERLGQLAAAGLSIAARGDLEPIYLREAHITQASERKVP